MKNISILSIRFPDLEAPRYPEKTKQQLFDAKRLAGKNKALFDKNNIDPGIFHNNTIEYSGIQLGNYHGIPEWTAIGNVPVKALKLWYKVFKKQNFPLLKNTVVIKERYSPEFLNDQKKYKIPMLLISDDLAKELNTIGDKFARNDRLEKYLYGNLQRFFKHIGFQHQKDQNFLKVNILEAHFNRKAPEVYHKQKKTAFEIVFSCNFLLPQTLRLGQSTALGYGSTFHL
jgi:hypothetical protein